MSNRAAIALGLVLILAILADALLNGGAATQDLLRRLVTAVEWLAFWQ